MSKKVKTQPFSTRLRPEFVEIMDYLSDRSACGYREVIERSLMLAYKQFSENGLPSFDKLEIKDAIDYIVHCKPLKLQSNELDMQQKTNDADDWFSQMFPSVAQQKVVQPAQTTNSEPVQDEVTDEELDAYMREVEGIKDGYDWDGYMIGNRKRYVFVPLSHMGEWQSVTPFERELNGQRIIEVCKVENPGLYGNLWDDTVEDYQKDWWRSFKPECTPDELREWSEDETKPTPDLAVSIRELGILPCDVFGEYYLLNRNEFEPYENQPNIGNPLFPIHYARLKQFDVYALRSTGGKYIFARILHGADGYEKRKLNNDCIGAFRPCDINGYTDSDYRLLFGGFDFPYFNYLKESEMELLSNLDIDTSILTVTPDVIMYCNLGYTGDKRLKYGFDFNVLKSIRNY